ncbi:MAG: TIGR03087 family PEP-CTERM/XrtA system glycosyltransferase [Novosphingobium sp.]
MREILFLSHRIPFPPNRGDKIRSHHLLRRLTRLARVHVATFADGADDADQEIELASIASTYRLVRRAKPMIVSAAQSLLSGRPISLHAFYNEALADYVRITLQNRAIGTIVIFSGQMGQYVPAGFTGRVVADFVDVDSVKFEEYAAQRKGLAKWAYSREARLLREEEARIARQAAVSLLISAEEAALFSARLSAVERAETDVRVLPNGIDSDFFDPTGSLAEPALEVLDGPKLIFTGQMDYPPNIAAAIRTAQRIMPLIRETSPAATFHIVGRNPGERVKQLDGVNGTRVWGSVEDIRPWLKAADIALVPLEIGRGVQNKVLEAMAMCRPTVLTAAAATGIPATDAKHFLIADSDSALALAVCRLIADKASAREMGREARAFVVDRFSWSQALADLPEIIDLRSLVVQDAT